MSQPFHLSIEVSKPYEFHKDALVEISQNIWVKNQWPLVYFIQNGKRRIAYVGESTNAASRIKSHLSNPEKADVFDTITIIGSDKFNKSATLDIESNLIQYISAEGSYLLQNGNFGLINHNYYQKDLYKDHFKEIWSQMMAQKIVSRSLSEIENSELFKYSPYKALNEDQYHSVLEILNGLTAGASSQIFISGTAGTGKTILATYLIKLLYSEVSEIGIEEFNDDELREITYIKAFQKKYPNAKIGLVIAMTSLRESLQNVFRKVPGLKPSMVISPSETFKLGEKYDLLIVDEAHRLRQYRNIGWLGTFKKNNQKLGLDDSGTELDWIMANSKNQIFFYDAAQSVKPSDVDAAKFSDIIKSPETLRLQLQSQMRVKGGNSYISFVDDLLHIRRNSIEKFKSNRYELLFFDSLADLYKELEDRENLYGLCRLVAGYSWPWVSDSRLKPKPLADATDMAIDGLAFKWNSTQKDWVNSTNAFKEVGSIHTVQGYDLNYTGVIFGREIDYNVSSGQIEIDPKLYFDKYGKNGITDSNDLKDYIINIYKTIMYRGIKGTFVYACNKGLRDYLKLNIPTYSTEKLPFRILPFEDVKPYVNSVPLFDITVAAGSFSDLQLPSELEWVELPMHISVKEGYFVCRIIGDSMNKKIPNGSYCLFNTYTGGSRNGKIVLVEHYNRQDSEFGGGYTIKEYWSEKNVSEEGWSHQSIVLKPLSNDESYENIVLNSDEMESFKVVGMFECVIC